MQITAIFHGCKMDNFQMKIFDIFLSFAQNIDCGYTLEPEAVQTSTHNLCFRAKLTKKMYTPVNRSFTILKWGARGCKLHGCVIMMYNVELLMFVSYI